MNFWRGFWSVFELLPISIISALLGFLLCGRMLGAW